MRICLATTVFPRWPGDGEGPFIWQFVRVLRQQGIEVRIVAMHSPGTPVYEQWEGVEIVRPEYWWPSRFEKLRKDGGGLPINFRRYRLARIQLLPLLFVHAVTLMRLGRDCTLVHGQFTFSAAAAVVAQAVHRRPVVATVHGSDIFQVPALRFGTSFTRHTLMRCAAITTVSSALAGVCASMNIPASRLHVIANSIDTEFFAPPTNGERATAILFVGSLIRRKGVDTLIHAMPQVLAVHPGQRLVIIGEGPEEAALRSLSANLGIDGEVDFLGFQSQKSVRAWMQRAELFVLPSREEGQGVVLLEALACGTPVVASQVGGIPEVIIEGIGVLVEPDNAPLLAQEIIGLLSDAAWRQQCSRAGRRYVEERYSPQTIGARYKALYEAVAS